MYFLAHILCSHTHRTHYTKFVKLRRAVGGLQESAQSYGGVGENCIFDKKFNVVTRPRKLSLTTYKTCLSYGFGSQLNFGSRKKFQIPKQFWVPNFVLFCFIFLLKHLKIVFFLPKSPGIFTKGKKFLIKFKKISSFLDHTNGCLHPSRVVQTL